MNCMCGHLGVEGITSPEDKKDEGMGKRPSSVPCADTRPETRCFWVEAWAITCNTWKETGPPGGP